MDFMIVFIKLKRFRQKTIMAAVRREESFSPKHSESPWKEDIVDKISVTKEHIFLREIKNCINNYQSKFVDINI